MKLLVNNEYGGFSIGEEGKRNEALVYLMRKGYSRKQSENILHGDCPRDLPVLHEVFEKFGQWEYGKLEYRELPEQPYYIENYDGIERIRTLNDFTNPEEPFEPERSAGDWELVDVKSEKGRNRLVEVLNTFVGGGEAGTGFSIITDLFMEDIKTVKRTVTSFFIPKNVAGKKNTFTLWAHGKPGEEPFLILESNAFSEANFEVVHSEKTVTVFFLQGKLGEERITLTTERKEVEA